MNAMPVTAVASAILGFFFIVLSVRVTVARARADVSLGDGSGTPVTAGREAQAPPLFVAIRSHANLCEYVPLSLILLGLVERLYGLGTLPIGLAAMLVVGRLLHPLGMRQKMPNPVRGGGIILNLLMIAFASVALLIRAIGAA
jgi:hypothetical protein